MTIDNLPMIADKNIVSYSNSLVEARYSLSLVEQKLVFAMVSLISPEDTEFKVYRISINNLADYMNIHRKTAIREIDRVTDNVLREIIKIPRINAEGEPELYKTHWASHCSLTNKVFEFSFHNKLIPYLLKLKTHFTMHRYKILVQFRGVYSVRIYQILKSHEYKGECEYSVDELRDILGISNEKYKTFKSFRQWVINPAKKEMSRKDSLGNHVSDIIFDIETIKSGRFIKSIKFCIKRQSYQERLPLSPSITDYPSKVFGDLIGYGIGKQLAEEVIEDQGEEVISRCIKMYELKLKENKVNDTSGAYLVSMLKAGAGKETRAETLRVAERQENKDNEINKILVKKKEKIRKNCAKKIREEYISELSIDDIDRLLATMKESLPQPVREVAKDLSSPLFADMLNKTIPNFEEKLRLEMHLPL